jgi:regulator of replication initiation timing
MNIEKLAKHLPDGLSKSGLKEVADIVDDIVQERVEKEVRMLESKVSGFLRTKLNSLKEVARKEVEAESETIRAAKVYETIRTLVAQDLEERDVDSAVSELKQEKAELQESIDSLNSQIAASVQENTILNHKVTSLKEDNANLTETTKLPFKSSESAVVIHNNPDSSRPSVEAATNIFLTEDVINLAKAKGEK